MKSAKNIVPNTKDSIKTSPPINRIQLLYNAWRQNSSPVPLSKPNDSGSSNGTYQAKSLQHFYQMQHHIKPVGLCDEHKKIGLAMCCNCNTPTTPVEEKPTPTQEVLKNILRFILGGVAGMMGAASVYPIDVVKTRLQNQKRLPDGELLYKNTVHGFKMVYRSEGFFGFYRGMLPMLVGNVPEKALKLGVNDLMRDLLTDANGHISIPREIIAGGTGGFCQIIFTNPLEIVKIQMQMAGESGERRKATHVLKELGFRQLYRGARACWLRDIVFSGIYFPAYRHLKDAFADENGKNSLLSLFAAACISGLPATSIVTPADVIKTRLQVRDQTYYKGVIDCGRKIISEEGFKVLFRGAFARCSRSAPQFGLTILLYECLQKLFSEYIY